MLTTETLLLCIVAYLLGSVPFGLLLSRIAGLGDVRDIGSGNIGATNVLRTGKKGIAALTLLCDLLKGTLAVLLARYAAPDAAYAAALFAILGHMFPLWLRFKGGKGVATCLGVLLGLAPWLFALAGLLWLAVFGIWRISSLAAIVSLAVTPVPAWFWGGNALALTALIAGLLVIFRHKENINRLLLGEEPRFGGGKTDEDEHA